jgi:hypothetical protein
MHSAACAGVTYISPMSSIATVAMWPDAKLTKPRRISSHLSDWFQQPIKAWEMNAAILAGHNHVKRKYDSYQIEDDIKKWQEFNPIKSNTELATH